MKTSWLHLILKNLKNKTIILLVEMYTQKTIFLTWFLVGLISPISFKIFDWLSQIIKKSSFFLVHCFYHHEWISSYINFKWNVYCFNLVFLKCHGPFSLFLKSITSRIFLRKKNPNANSVWICKLSKVSVNFRAIWRWNYFHPELLSTLSIFQKPIICVSHQHSLIDISSADIFWVFST